MRLEWGLPIHLKSTRSSSAAFYSVTPNLTNCIHMVLIRDAQLTMTMDIKEYSTRCLGRRCALCQFNLVEGEHIVAGK